MKSERTDTERLDWLEENAHPYPKTDAARELVWVCRRSLVDGGYVLLRTDREPGLPTMRAAIDDVMLAEAAKGKEEPDLTVPPGVILFIRKRAEEYHGCGHDVSCNRALRLLADDLESLKDADLPEGEPPLCQRTMRAVANRLEAAENHHTSAASFICDWIHELRQEAKGDNRGSARH